MGRYGKAWAALTLAGALAACGGGGGGGGGGPAPPTVFVWPPSDCTTEVVLANNTSACTFPGARTDLASAADSLNEWSNDPGFSGQPALNAVKAHYAYGTGGRGFYGNGVTIAVLADGVETTNRQTSLLDAAGNARVSRVTEVTVGSTTLTAQSAAAQDCGYSSPWTCIGTRAAAVMAGQVHNPAADADAQLGVAPQARILDVPAGEFWTAFCAISGNNCNRAAPFDTTAVRNYASVLGAAMQAALAQTDKPRYVYLHYAGNYDSDNGNTATPLNSYLPFYDPSHSNQVVRSPIGLDNAYQRHLLSTMGAAVWQGGPGDGEDSRSVFVVPAGFDRGRVSITSPPCASWLSPVQPSCRTGTGVQSAHPRIFAVLPEIATLVGTTEVPMGSDLQPTFLTVVGMDGTSLHTSGNRCGRAAAWCLAAPTSGFETLAHMGTGANIATGRTGIEYAAAVVVGALALVDSAFNVGSDSVSPVAIRKRLLDTADKSGSYAATANYGQGVLDIQAALTPQGTGAMPSPPVLPGTRTSVRAAGLSLLGLRLALPGHALAALGQTRVLTLDSHGFPFYMQLRDLARTPFAPASLFADMAAQTAAPLARSESGFLSLSAGVGSGAAWGSALTPRHLSGGNAQGTPLPLAAGAHLAVSPLMASSLEGTGTSHVAVRASFGQQSIAAMACTQRHTEVEQGQVQGDGDNACMALGWDWHRGDSFGLSVRTHVLDSRGGLYRYGTRCFGGSCGGGGAAATELGLGGFAKLSQGLRLGWNWWHGWADDLDGGSDVVRYSGLGHSAGSLALESADGAWSLYLQQPLRAEGRLQLVLPTRRDPAGHVYFASHHLRLDGAARPLRLGLSSRLDLTRRGGFLALDLGAERGVDGFAGTHPYLALETSIPW